jgi:hypothetical protein
MISTKQIFSTAVPKAVWSAGRGKMKNQARYGIHYYVTVAGSP